MRSLGLALVASSCLLVGCVVETEPVQEPARRPVVVAAVPHADAALPPAPPPPADALRACQVDADCVAVLKNGCCHDGLNVAVSKASADAYTSSFTCPVAHPVCPMHLVLDQRAAVCDTATHLCNLAEVAPTEHPSP